MIYEAEQGRVMLALCGDIMLVGCERRNGLGIIRAA
jgi:hypothetical protein